MAPQGAGCVRAEEAPSWAAGRIIEREGASAVPKDRARRDEIEAGRKEAGGKPEKVRNLVLLEGAQGGGKQVQETENGGELSATGDPSLGAANGARAVVPKAGREVKAVGVARVPAEVPAPFDDVGWGAVVGPKGDDNLLLGAEPAQEIVEVVREACLGPVESIEDDRAGVIRLGTKTRADVPTEVVEGVRFVEVVEVVGEERAEEESDEVALDNKAVGGAHMDGDEGRSVAIAKVSEPGNKGADAAGGAVFQNEGMRGASAIEPGGKRVFGVGLGHFRMRGEAVVSAKPSRPSFARIARRS